MIPIKKYTGIRNESIENTSKIAFDDEIKYELKRYLEGTIDGKRGNADSMSLHSWGVAIDVNAAWNGFGKKPTLSTGFVKCFTA